MPALEQLTTRNPVQNRSVSVARRIASCMVGVAGVAAIVVELCVGVESVCCKLSVEKSAFSVFEREEGERELIDHDVLHGLLSGRVSSWSAENVSNTWSMAARKAARL